MPLRTILATALIASCVSSALTLVMALLVLAPSIRAAPDPQAVEEVVRTKRLEIIDSKGQVRGLLYTLMPGEDGTESIVTLGLQDSGNSPRVGMTAFPYGSIVTLDDGRNARVTLSAWDTPRTQGVVGLDVHDERRQSRVRVGQVYDVEHPGEYTVWIRDAASNIWQAP